MLDEGHISGISFGRFPHAMVFSFIFDRVIVLKNKPGNPGKQ
jgi:hypothetical protein